MGKKIEAPPVRVGSIWADRRAPGRSVQVVAIEHDYAVCVTLTNSLGVQRILDLAAEGRWLLNTRDMRGSRRRILLNRFRPTNNGFTHVTDAPQITDEALTALLRSG